MSKLIRRPTSEYPMYTSKSLGEVLKEGSVVTLIPGEIIEEESLDSGLYDDDMAEFCDGQTKVTISYIDLKDSTFQITGSEDWFSFAWIISVVEAPLVLNIGNKIIFKPRNLCEGRPPIVQGMCPFLDGKTPVIITDMNGWGEGFISHNRDTLNVYSRSWVQEVVGEVDFSNTLRVGDKVLIKNRKECSRILSISGNEDGHDMNPLFGTIMTVSRVGITSFSAEENDWYWDYSWIESVNPPSREFTYENLRPGDMVLLKPMEDQPGGIMGQTDGHRPDYDGKTPVQFMSTYPSISGKRVIIKYSNNHTLTEGIFFERLLGFAPESEENKKQTLGDLLRKKLDLPPLDAEFDHSTLKVGDMVTLKPLAEQSGFDPKGNLEAPRKDYDGKTPVKIMSISGTFVSLLFSTGEIHGGIYKTRIKGLYEAPPSVIAPSSRIPAGTKVRLHTKDDALLLCRTSLYVSSMDEFFGRNVIVDSEVFDTKHAEFKIQGHTGTFCRTWIKSLAYEEEPMTSMPEEPLTKTKVGVKFLTVDRIKDLDGHDLDRVLFETYGDAQVFSIKCPNDPETTLLVCSNEFLQSFEDLKLMKVLGSQYAKGGDLNMKWGTNKVHASLLGTCSSGCCPYTESFQYRFLIIPSVDLPALSGTVTQVAGMLHAAKFKNGVEEGEVEFATPEGALEVKVLA